MNDIQRQLTDMVYQDLKDSNPEAINIGFDAAVWVHNWIITPLPAIGGIMPINLLDTPKGPALVITILKRSFEGSYSICYKWKWIKSNNYYINNQQINIEF